MRFKCGCDITHFDPFNLPDCKMTWDLISSGNTKGIFQVESYLGKHWSKRLKPDSIELLSGLISIIRPGVMNTKDERGISMTEVFCKRRHGEEEFTEVPEVGQFLRSTFQVMTYQEQVMFIAKHIAGFDLKEADQLRKAIGTKNAELMSKTKELFIKKGLEVGLLGHNELDKLINDIEKSNRYSFNKCLYGKTKLKNNKSIEELYNTKNYGIGYSLYSNKIKQNTIVDIRYEGKQPTYKITLENDSSIIATTNHKFPTDMGDLPLSELRIGDELYSCGSDNNLEKVKIKSIEFFGEEDVYDVEMEAPHNFVTEDNIVTCNSHSTAYAEMGYITAYIKAHFPLQFYTSWIKFSNDEQDPKKELRELVNDARENGIEVLPPKLRYWSKDTHIKDGKIYLGLSQIKGVGEKSIDKITPKLMSHLDKLGKDLFDLEWFDILLMTNIFKNKNLQNFIQAGALSYLGLSRKEMLAELTVWELLTDKEQAHLIKNRGKNLLETLKNNLKVKSEGGCCNTEPRLDMVKSLVNSLEKPSSSLRDTPLVLTKFELDMLGICLTSNKSTMINQNLVDTDCATLVRNKRGIVGIEIQQVKIVKIKKGINKGADMCFFTGEDESGTIEFVCFPQQYEEYKANLLSGNLIMVDSYIKDKSAIVRQIWQA